MPYLLLPHSKHSPDQSSKFATQTSLQPIVVLIFFFFIRYTNLFKHILLCTSNKYVFDCTHSFCYSTRKQVIICLIIFFMLSEFGSLIFFFRVAQRNIPAWLRLFTNTRSHIMVFILYTYNIIYTIRQLILHLLTVNDWILREWATSVLEFNTSIKPAALTSTRKVLYNTVSRTINISRFKKKIKKYFNC